MHSTLPQTPGFLCGYEPQILHSWATPCSDDSFGRLTCGHVLRPHAHGVDWQKPHADFVTYLDLHSGFVDASGLQIPELFNDGLHPTEAGYAIWRDRLIALLNAKRAAGKTK